MSRYQILGQGRFGWNRELFGIIPTGKVFLYWTTETQKGFFNEAIFLCLIVTWSVFPTKQLLSPEKSGNEVGDSSLLSLFVAYLYRNIFQKFFKGFGNVAFYKTYLNALFLTLFFDILLNPGLSHRHLRESCS